MRKFVLTLCLACVAGCGSEGYDSYVPIYVSSMRTAEHVWHTDMVVGTSHGDLTVSYADSGMFQVSIPSTKHMKVMGAVNSTGALEPLTREYLRVKGQEDTTAEIYQTTLMMSSKRGSVICIFVHSVGDMTGGITAGCHGR